MCLGIPGKVVSIEGSPDDFMMIGKVNFGGSFKEVSLAYVPEVKVGDFVVVHAGFALNILNEDEANEVFGYLEEIEKKLAEEAQNTDTDTRPDIAPKESSDKNTLH